VKRQQRLSELAAVVRGMIYEDSAPEQVVIKPRPIRGSNLSVYIFGDPHAGLLCWAPEVGHNYDLKIFRKVHLRAMAELLDTQDSSNSALVVFLGDNTHSSDESQLTPRSGHKLDVEGRFAKVVRESFVTFRDMTLLASKHHGPVRTSVIALQGNHCASVTLALKEYLSASLGRRAQVLENSNPYTVVPFGRTMIGLHHGDGCRGAKLAGVFAADFPKQWGEAEHRWIVHGHVHSSSVVEVGGAKVESFPTLAPADYYAHHGGWRSERSASVVELNAKRGEIRRHKVRP
jgi:predicted phosphodiesterase